MDYSAANADLWRAIITFGILAGVLLLSNFLVRKVGFIRRALIPTAALAGFIVLLLREVGVLNIDAAFMDMITYHGIALGFIAMSLRVPNEHEAEFKKERAGLKSGAVIISTYVVQGLLGLAISIGLAYTFMPDMFPAAGILLPMGFGQGPGQANNVGSMYQQAGFAGGQSFGLSIAAAGYLCACTVGVIYMAIMRKRGKIKVHEPSYVSGSVSVDVFQAENEIPISQSVDRFSVQVALVLLVYLATYLVSWGITSALNAWAPGLAASVNSLIWGFNFIVGSAMAILTRVLFKGLRKAGIMKRQYQNNYLLNRLSGVAFDFMIICGIGVINISDLKGLWIPFLLMTISGAIVTLVYLHHICKKTFPGYFYEGLLSMYGMLTGTISSGVLLLREIDPMFESPAANNLVTGSSYAILLGAPMLLLISLAPQSTTLLFLTVGLLVVYLAALLVLLYFLNRERPAAKDK